MTHNSRGKIVKFYLVRYINGVEQRFRQLHYIDEDLVKTTTNVLEDGHCCIIDCCDCREEGSEKRLCEQTIV